MPENRRQARDWGGEKREKTLPQPRSLIKRAQTEANPTGSEWIMMGVMLARHICLGGLTSPQLEPRRGISGAGSVLPFGGDANENTRRTAVTPGDKGTLALQMLVLMTDGTGLGRGAPGPNLCQPGATCNPLLQSRSPA